MTIVINPAKKAIHDKLESQVKSVDAKLQSLKARAEAGKAVVEIRAIADLMPESRMLRQKLQDLKESGEDRWQQAKADLEDGIAELEKSAKEIEANTKAN
jgi:hypothetical protein